MIVSVDKGKAIKYSYESIIERINSIKDIRSTIVRDVENPIDFYTKFLVAIIHNIDVVVLDDINKVEEENSIVTNTIHLHSIEECIERIKKSSSKISLFTSGSTGLPKKITHPISRFIDMVREGYNDKQTWALLYDPSHMAGFQVFFQAFLQKTTLVYMYEINRVDFMKIVDLFQITHISATPTFYRLLSPYQFQLNSVRRCTSGGEKITTHLIEKLKYIFPNAKINNIYASTEAGSIFVSTGEFFRVIPEYVHKIKFIDNEIYLHKSLLGVFQDKEWFATGDMVEFIDGNQFKIVSRKSEFVNVGGNRVNLLEVENKIRELGCVTEVLVGTTENSVLGTVLKADVVLSEVVEKKEFKIKLRELLPKHMIPMKIKFVESLNKTNSGKLKR